ncbi:MAG: serine/threonine protein kinase [Deltaproteobacteria bacterium]|nr:serine/threonine protein kinase [Deltaproteobacteria bacterium]
MAQTFPVPFGKYLLTDLIAVGGMAEIYRAKIFGVNGFEKQMVVKRILSKYAQNPSFVQMFVDEAKVLVSLTHGNIVPVYELGEVGGNYYIAMEYAEGMTALDLLRECYVKNRPLPVAIALYIAAEVAKGLGYAHGRTAPDGSPLGIVHRDLNPRNVVVSPAGEVKILDFGIARSSVKKHQTGSGVIKGTPGYMSPEQVMGYSVDARADQYGLAIILHELLTVRRLISVKDAVEHRAKLAEGPLPIPSTLRGDIPKSVDEVVMKALSTRAEDRYPSALDFEDALRGEIARLGVAVTSRGLSEAIKSVKAAVAVEGLTAPPTRPPESRSRPQTEPMPSSMPAMSQPAVPTAPAPEPVVAPAPAPAPQEPLPAVVSSASATDLLRVREDFTEVHKQTKPQDVLPSLPVASVSNRPAVQVLAKNDELGWAGKIGNDAEMLVLAKAMGLKSRTPQRVALGGLAAVALVSGVWVVSNREEAQQMVTRAQEGRRAVTGTLIVKSKPSGATVLVDGKESGKTNLRLDQVVLDKPFTLVVRLPDGQELSQQLDMAAFKPPDRKVEIMFDPAAAAVDAGPPPDAAAAKDEAPEKKPRKKKKRG